MIPDWLAPMIALAPLAAWIFLGAGLPWALALLPRGLWHERAVVLAVGMALGPLGYTAAMAALGAAGALRLGPTLAASALVALPGMGIALWRWRRGRPEAPVPLRDADRRWGAAEWLILAAIALVVVATVAVIAYWPFLAYDPQWVYAYNARLFVLDEAIPDGLGYYPPHLSLSYTTFQQAWSALGGDAIDDHAARAVLPWYHAALALMAYTLGRLAFRSRRVGLLTAAIWTLYPHSAAWAGAGDLEAPLTLYLTGASAFFIEAWRGGRAREAALSGVLLGGALWTKPTAGAWALGVALAIAGWALITRLKWAALWPKLRVALVTGLASAPLGGAWYIRNLLLGHEAVTFPADYWHGFAQRSGQELGWPILLALLAAGGLMIGRAARQGERRFPRWLPLLAVGLLLAGALPSALDVERVTQGNALRELWRWLRGDLTARGALSLPETLLVIAGAGLLVASGLDAWRGWPRARRETVLLLWALALPYGVVWFFNYSYHYRLSFAIVPLLAVQAAALIDGWLWPWLAGRRAGRVAGTLAIAASAALAVAAAVEFSARPWLDGSLRDDRAKYDAGNPALMVVVHMLEDYAAEHGEPVVVAPGEERLPFYFPTWDIRTSRALDALPARLEDLEGADLYLAGSVSDFLMQQAGKWPNSLTADAAVAVAYHRVGASGPDGAPWPTVLEPIPLSPDGSLPVDDGNFRFNAFTIHPEARATPMQPGGRVAERVLFGDFAEFIGYDMSNLAWTRGQRIILTLYWRPTASAPPPRDYSIFIHLLDQDGDRLTGWDGVPLQGAYPTRFWRPGESLLDYWILPVPEDIPAGTAALRIGIYDPIEGGRLPVTVGGEPAGDGLVLRRDIEVK